MTKATLSLISEDDYVDDLTIYILKDLTLVLQTHGTQFQAYIPKELIPQVYQALSEYVEDDTRHESCLPEGAHLRTYTLPVVGKYGHTLLHSNMPHTSTRIQELTTSYAAIFEFKISNVPAQALEDLSDIDPDDKLYDDNGLWIGTEEALSIMELLESYL